eukprot:maker-scaffold104_size368486-snap-gene-0.9 protein:Tk07535 transcript:maker-scaffold104_size368486-snap-gene-0.9-mRNA-1 annotation:"hypothetical protein L798_11134"
MSRGAQLPPDGSLAREVILTASQDDPPFHDPDSNPRVLDPALLSPSIEGQGSLRQRRKSPVTVQEWVASLPPPHVLQRRDFESPERVEDNNGPQDEQDNELETLLTNSSQVDDGRLKSQLAPGDLEDAQKLHREREVRGNLRRHNLSHENQSSGLPEDPKGKEDITSDDMKLGADAETSNHEAGRFKIFRGNDSRGIGSALGGSGTMPVNGDVQIPSGSFKSSTLEARRRIFLRSHDHLSFHSDISGHTVSSVDSVLYSREVDPAELLMDLGFGGQSTDLLTRIPERFFRPSQAKGISVEEFLRTQEELAERFDSGFDGYLGLNGSSSSRPSEIVEKIFERIRSQDHSLKRQSTRMSGLSSRWASSGSLFQAPNAMMLPGLGVSAGMPHFLGPNFATIVNHAQHQQMAFARHIQPPLKGARAFKAVAHSVLNPANRRFIESQEEQGIGPNRTMVIGGQSYQVDEDLNVIEEEESEDGLGSEVSLPFSKRSLLSKRDSTLSIQSSCSIDSDWSDEENEEWERILEDIQERSEAVDKQLYEEDEALELREKARERWQRLRRDRPVAMHRAKQPRKQHSLARITTEPTKPVLSQEPGNGSLPKTPSSNSTEPTQASAVHYRHTSNHDHQLMLNQSHQRQQFMRSSILHSDHRIPRRFSTQYQI